jgi:hypothetical protein
MLPAVRDLDVPVVLVNVQKKKAPDYANTDTPTWLGELYACGAVGEMVADLERAGKRHAVITGVVEGGDPAVQAEINDWCKAAQVRRRFRDTNLAQIGRPYPGMMDLYIDETNLYNRIWLYTKQFDWEKMWAIADNITDEDAIRAKAQDMHESGNGTFLQTRNFLNYHPAGRFTDVSLMVYNEHGGLGAVVPAALRLDGATRIFRSHPGSTFGGPVLRSTYNSAAKSIGILQAVEDYIATRYDAADFRPTPDLFNGVENVALQYAFTYLGYTQQTELSTWVPVAGRTPETLLASFRQNKKQDVKKALKQDLTFRKLETRAEIDAFHALLRQNLQKFGVEPVHTADELWATPSRPS